MIRYLQRLSTDPIERDTELAKMVLAKADDEATRFTLPAWLLDQLKSFGIGLLLAWGGVGIIYTTIRVSPERWWLGAGFLFAAVTVGLVAGIVPAWNGARLNVVDALRRLF